MPDLESQTDGLITFFTKTAVAFGINLMAAVAILVVGWWLSGKAAIAVQRMMDRWPNIDVTLKPLAAIFARQAVLVITLLMVLGRFGVETTSIIAVLGAAGLAIGLALQGTLSNVAAGVMLLILRPFGVGDAIEVGSKSGTVKQIGLFTVELTSFDNLYISMPNSSVWNSPIINYSKNPIRRIDLLIGIDYGDDIDLAISSAMDEIRKDERILSEPAPLVAVKQLGESSVDLVVRGHTALADFWPTQFALLKNIKQRFDAEGITIPFPQRTLTLGASEAALATRAVDVDGPNPPPIG